MAAYSFSPGVDRLRSVEDAMNEYVFINIRVVGKVYATLYRHGSGYAVTDWHRGITEEFATIRDAKEWRERLRPY